MNKYDEVHFMLDVESLSLQPDAVICTIGCCTVNPFIRLSDPNATISVTSALFYTKIDWQVEDGHISTDTLKWWFDKERSQDARQELTQSKVPTNKIIPTIGKDIEPVTLSVAMDNLMDFFKRLSKPDRVDNKNVYIWTTNNFDTSLIQYRFKQFGIPWPFYYRNICNIRDIYRTAKIKDPTFDAKEYMKNLTTDKFAEHRVDFVAHRADSDCITQSITLAEAYRIILS